MTAARDQAAACREELMVVAVTAHTGFPGQRLAPGAVLVSGPCIVSVGTLHEMRLRHPGAAELDLGDAVLLPGFVDAHVHLAFDATELAVEHLKDQDDAQLGHAMAARAGALLSAGVTTARDLGSRGNLVYELRTLIENGAVEGPNLLCAGPPLTSPGGHAWYFGGEADGERGLRTAVRQRQAAGADWVKLVVSGGYLTEGTDPSIPQFTDKEIAAVVDEATQAGLPVAAHLHATTHIASALGAGVSTIEHCTLVGAEADQAELVTAMAAAGTAVCPTVNAGTLSLPPPGGGPAVARLTRLIGSGVRIIMGTDAGVPGARHDAYAEGLVLLGQAGMSNTAALHAATSGAAAALGLGHVTGRLAPGLRADMVALGADPVENLKAVRDVRWVMSAGRAAAQPAAITQRVRP